MLQFLTQPADKYSVLEQCQMVIEGECRWIQIHKGDCDEVSLRHIAEELIPLCKETQTILTLEDNPELAKALGIHGVHLTLDCELEPEKIREELGPEAIIGCDIATVQQPIKLRNADIDYFTLSEALGLETIKTLISDVKAAGVETPIVLRGNFRIEDTREILNSGADGICTGKYIFTASDPVKYTMDFISALQHSKISDR